VAETIRAFPWPKSMRWGEGGLRWVRPLRSILCLLSDEAESVVVPVEIEGVPCGDVTAGHRVMAPGTIRVRDFDDYASRLEGARVVLDAAERARRIEADAANLAFAQGLEVIPDPGLLAEVAGLVEWPVPLIGEIGADFLDLPPEVLRTSMKEHQKFFSVRNPATGRIEKFVTVANLEAHDGGATILAGNRRVLAARLSDAKFFWENDLRTIREGGMDAMAGPLSRVTFHSKLGTQAERIDRIAALAREIAPSVGADADMAEQAARACKADLASEMVYEFPELQGTMGRYYAEAAGLAPEVAAACAEHYAPLGPSDDVPTAPVSVAVALADKIDMLTGFWAIDEKPTGSKDPFALRRAALGCIRILLETDQRRPLVALAIRAFNRHIEAMRARDDRAAVAETDMAAALDGVEGDLIAAATKLLEDRLSTVEAERRAQLGLSLVAMTDLQRFFNDRLKVFLRDRGVRHDVIDAVAGPAATDVIAVRVRKAEALQAFLDTEEGANLLSGYRRAANILAAEEKKDGPVAGAPDPALAEAGPEATLMAVLDDAEPALDAALAQEDFAAAMAGLAALRAPIDAFFEAVVVNADDPALRANRLRLLNRIRSATARVADLSVIEG
jgi:glycyl-tRNA synthetase beta chain